MSRTAACATLVLGMLLSRGAWSDDQPSHAARLKAVQAELESAEAAYWKARESLPEGTEDDPEVDRLGEAAAGKRRVGIAAALEIARAEPQSNVGFDALQWLLLQASGVYSQPAGVPALELMAKHHST